MAAEVALYAMDLTVYEVGDSLWKLAALLGALELGDAEDAVCALSELARRGAIRVVRFEELDLSRVVRLAASERVTFYDASYVVASEEVGAPLVTEDEELGERARRYVSVLRCAEFERAVLGGRRAGGRRQR